MSAAATGHFLTRTIVPLNLSNLPELRFWFRATQPSDGSPDRPFRLRLQLGSAALPVGAVGNTWHRYLPVAQANGWQFVRVALDDLAPAVASAVNTLRFTCVNTTLAWTGWLDDLIAVRPEVIADVDAALLAQLNLVLNLGGTPVPAQVDLDGMADPTAPWIRIIHYEAAYSDLRTSTARPRTDFTDTGFRLRPEAVAYDLFYRIEAVADDRADQAAILEFVLDRLGHRRGLLVNGALLQLDRVPTPERLEEADSMVGLCYRVATLQERGTQQPVLPVQETRLTADLMS